MLPMVYVDISCGASGMLIPVLSSAGTNLPYVQQMDEFMRVRELVPFLDYENYPTVPTNDDREINVGDEGLIVFRSFDGCIISGNSSEIISYIHANRSVIAQRPILYAQLQRIEAATLTSSYEVWREVAAILFPGEPQRKLWIESEHLLFQRQKQIWAQIERIGNRRDSSAHGGLSDKISEYSVEKLFGWLTDRRNFLEANWTKEWHRLRELEPFGNRGLELALAWMFHLAAENHDLRQIRSVLYSCLEISWDVSSELSEFLTDTFSTEPSLLFNFLRPKRLFGHLLNAIVAHGDMDRTIKLIEFGVKELPKEDYVVDALTSALHDVSVSDPSTSLYADLLAIRLYPYTQQYIDRDRRTGAKSELAKLERVAIELIDQATSLEEREMYEEANAILDFALIRFGTATELRLRVKVAEALHAKAEMLRRQHDWEKAVAVYDDLLGRFSNAREVSLRVEVAAALRAKAACLRDVGEDDNEPYRNLITRFGGARESALREQVAGGMLSKAREQYETFEIEGAIAIYEEFFNLFGTASPRPLCEQVTTAFEQLGLIESDLVDMVANNPENKEKLLERINLIYKGQRSGATGHARGSRANR
jgi:hypothetical protein